MTRPARALALAALVLVLTACGWQLRGAGGGGFEGVAVSVEGAVGNRLLDEVRVQLRDLGAEVVGAAADARIVVEVIDAQTRRRTVTTGADGFASEYELRYRLRFRAAPGGLAGPDQPVIAAQAVQASANYAATPRELQGQEAEEQALRAGLAAEVIQQMLARVGRQLQD